MSLMLALIALGCLCVVGLARIAYDTWVATKNYSKWKGCGYGIK